MHRNILLINHYAGSRIHGMEYRPYYLAREWVRQGHRVTIAAASHSHVRQHSPVFGGPVGEEMIDGIRYVWLKTPGYDGNGWRRAVSMFSFVLQLYRRQERLVRKGKVDVVIASSTYPFDIYPARTIALQQKAKLIFEVHDLWPLSPIEVGGMSPRHPFIWALQRAEDYAYRRADRVVSLLPNAHTYMVSRGMRPDRFAYVPNGVDIAEWRASREPLPVAMRSALRRLRGENKFLVGYAGALGLANALDSLIDAAALLRDVPVAFVVVGQGPEEDRLRQRISSEGVANLVIFPSIPKASVPTFLAELDAAYIGLKQCSLFRFGVSPNKLMDYMMAGKPIIQAIAAGNDMVTENRCGFSVTPESPQELANAVKRLMSMSRFELREMGESGRGYVERRHNYTTLAQQFIQLIDGCEPRSAPGASSRLLPPFSETSSLDQCEAARVAA